MRIVGTMTPYIADEGRRWCNRCGRRLSGRALNRRPDGLFLCRDCVNDTWLIERLAKR